MRLAVALAVLAPFLLIGCFFTSCGGYDRELTWRQELPIAVLHRAEGLHDVPQPAEPRESALWSLHFLPAGLDLRYGARWNDTHVSLVRSQEDAFWVNRSSHSPDEAFPGAVLFIENVTGLRGAEAEAFARDWIHSPRGESFELVRPHGAIPLDEGFLQSLPWTTTESVLSHGNKEEDRPVAGEWLGVWDVTIEQALVEVTPASHSIDKKRVTVYEQAGRVHARVEGSDMTLAEAKAAIRQTFADWELPPPTFKSLGHRENCSW